MQRTTLFHCFWYFELVFIFTTVLIVCDLQSQSIGLENTNNWMSVQQAQSYEWNITESESSFHAIVKLEQLPTATQQDSFEQLGMLMVEAIAHRIYLFQLTSPADFQQLPLEGVLPFSASFKLSKRLRQGIFPDHAYAKGQLYVNVWPFPNHETEQLQQSLSLIQGLEVLHISATHLQVSIPMDSLENLALLKDVFYIEPKMPTPVPDGIGGRTLHRLNLLHNQPELGYDGQGIGIAIADDGVVNHIDFKGRITQLLNNDFGNHGEMTVGLAIGAGNLDPLDIGMAPGSHIKLYFIGDYPHINEAPTNLQEERIMITSTSYLEDCGGYYTHYASELDAQVYNHEELLHVFSAGNSASSACNATYGQVIDENGKRFGNITGGRKSSKAAIAVGNLTLDGQIHSASSRGPTADQRIKPDISASGQGQKTTGSNNSQQKGSGTSAAAPTVAGIAACLYQAYEETYESIPASGLIKATLLNTATDLGRPGPDYEYGWGQVHAARALDVLKNSQFITGNITDGNNKFYNLSVPQGVKEMKVMLYWNDPAGSVLASKALVNDLDLKIIQNNGSPLLPWTLSAYPHIDSLTQPAVRGIDRVNNMEQITLKNPSAGNFQIKVNGHQISQGPQNFFIVYCFDTTELEITYPVGGESLVPDDEIRIHWDASEMDGNFTVEWAENNSNSWQIIEQNIPSHQRSLYWNVPSYLSGAYKIRVRRNNQISQTDTYFSVLRQPSFDIQSLSPTQARIHWNQIPEADEYDIYMLGAQYMEYVGTSTENSFIFNTNIDNEHWISIIAKKGNLIKSRRTKAKQYIHQSCGYTVQLEINFDNTPQETSWEIRDEFNSIVMSGGADSSVQPNSTILESICLPEGCYDLWLYDTGANGLCCTNGSGFYKLSQWGGQIITSGSSFNSFINYEFCLDASQDPLVATIVQKNDVNCYGESTGSGLIQANGGSGNYTYIWSDGQQGHYANNLNAGVYTVTISDGQQQLIQSLNILQPLALEVHIDASPINCIGTGGSLNAQVTGGTPPYNYQWNNGMNTITLSNVEAGNYSLTVTDANGCQITASKNITTGSDMQVSSQINHPNCQGEQSGSAFIQVQNAVWPVHFYWNMGLSGQGIYGLSAGTYSVTIVDALGCEQVEYINIQDPPSLNTSALTINESCHNAKDGYIEAEVAGGTMPYSFNWSTASTEDYIENIGKGWYFLTVTDANGCQQISYHYIGAPNGIDIDAQITDASDNNGMIDLTVSGGTPPYSYIWNNGQFEEDISNLAPGNYEVQIFDINDCSSVKSFTILDVGGNYCTATGTSTAYEWIESVAIGNYSNISGNDGGYGDFTSSTIAMNIGNNYHVILEPGYTNSAFNESWRIWLDANQDGDFDDAGELIFSNTLSNSTINGIISLPANTASGFTRMRIGMKYGSPPNACGTLGYGEVEDYTIYIANGNLAAIPTNTLDQEQSDHPTLSIDHASAKLAVYPNPVSNELHITLPTVNPWDQLLLLNSKGQRVIQQAATHKNLLNLSHLPQGIYWLNIKIDNELISKKVVVLR